MWLTILEITLLAMFMSSIVIKNTRNMLLIASMVVFSMAKRLVPSFHQSLTSSTLSASNTLTEVAREVAIVTTCT